MELPTVENIVLDDAEGTVSTTGQTELILGIPNSKNEATLSLPFAYYENSFDPTRGSFSCLMDKKFIEEYKKFETALLNEARSLDIMADVTGQKSSIRTLKDQQKYLSIKCTGETNYEAYKNGKTTKIDKFDIPKDAAAIIACKAFVWKFEIGGKQCMGVSLQALDVTLINATVKKSTKKRVNKTLTYLKPPAKKGKMMEHKELEELNL